MSVRPDVPALPGARYWVAAFLAALTAYGLISLPGIARIWGITADGVLVLAGWTAIAAIALPLARARPAREIMALAILGILLLRIATAWPVAGRVSPGDPHSYLVLAQSLLAGNGLIIHEPYFDADYRALFPPLYPALLAAWGAGFGFGMFSLLALNTLVDGAAAWVIVRIGARLGQPGAGRAAGYLWLIWPSALFSAPLAQKESLSVLLVLLIALLWLRLADRSRRIDIALLGLAAAALALSQPGWAPIAALFGIVLIPRLGLRRVIATGAPAAAVAALAMLPWWMRNWMLFHAFVPLTTASGASLWIGNNPGATGNWMPPPDALKGLGERVYGPRAAALAREWIAANPGGFAHLTLQKFLRAGGVAEFGLIRLRALMPAPPAALLAALFPLSYLPHLAMLGSGSVAAIRTRTQALVPLLVACGAQLLLFGIWFEFGERHREFVTPFLLLLAMTAFRSDRD